jgi:hypothetical protein
MNANQGRPGHSDQTRREAIRQHQIGVSEAQQAMQANRAPKIPPASDEQGTGEGSAAVEPDEQGTGEGSATVPES